MKCPNCKAELRDGAKFCTKCGQKISQAVACISCGAELKPGAKFCTKCGTRQEAAPQQQPQQPAEAPLKRSGNQMADMTDVNGRIYWNVQPGQVARVIREDEFETYSKVKGVIVPEGTTAYIRSNGKIIASISGGAYDFVSGSNSMNSQQLGGGGSAENGGVLRRGWQFLCNLFGGKKKKAENTPPTPEEQLYLNQQSTIIQNAKKGASFSVIILLDKAFPLLVGAKQQSLDDYKNFVPMRIQTKFLEMNVGVNAYFKITDPEQFIVHYLTDKKQLNSASIVDEIADTMRVTLQDALYDTELTSNRIPAELHAMLKDRINVVARESFFGVNVVRIVEISAESKDLERFTKLSQELYLSEKELDFLLRSNDFKNRLADAVNAQQLHEATTAQELRARLNEINRNSRNEELLNADELRKFEHLLNNERILREARSDSERDLALMEIAQTGLVRKEELDALRHQLATNEFKRGAALRMMQLTDAIEFERVRTEGEGDRAVLMVRKELEAQGLKDDYADAQYYKELARQTAAANAQLDVEQRQRDMDFNDERRRRQLDREDDDAQFQQFMAMQDAEERNRENQRRHEAQMERDRMQNQLDTDRLKWENAQNLSAEQVWALQGGQEAAVAYASSLNDAKREREFAQQLAAERDAANARYDERLRQQDDMLRSNQDRMFEMMNNLINVTGGVQAQRSEERAQFDRERMAEKDRQLREREDRLQRQENRMDTAYDRALDYTTRNNVPQQPVQQQPVQQAAPQPVQQPVQQPAPSPAPAPAPAEKSLPAAVCKDCGSELEPGAAFCENCGAPQQ